MKINLTVILVVQLLLGCAHKPPAVLELPPPASGIIASVPFTLHDNRILVQVMLNGSGPYTMIFDTGGANTITPMVQHQLNLASQGREIGEGAGSTAFPIHTVHMRSLELGGLALADQKFMVIDLAKIRRAFGFAHLDGIIGLEVLERARVRVDFDNQRMVLLESSSPEKLRGGRVIPFLLSDEKPVIEGTINGKAAKILIDTGDRSNLTLFKNFAHASNLEELFARRERVITGLGLGGPIPGKIAALQSVNLGGQQIDNVLSRLPLTTGGYFARSDLSASAGIGLLKAFNLEFDYQKKQLTLLPRPGFKEPSTFVPVRR